MGTVLAYSNVWFVYNCSHLCLLHTTLYIMHSELNCFVIWNELNMNTGTVKTKLTTVLKTVVGLLESNYNA